MQHKLTWAQLEKLLQKADVLSLDEEIREVTLIKPRCLLLHVALREINKE